MSITNLTEDSCHRRTKRGNTKAGLKKPSDNEVFYTLAWSVFVLGSAWSRSFVLHSQREDQMREKGLGIQLHWGQRQAPLKKHPCKHPMSNGCPKCPSPKLPFIHDKIRAPSRHHPPYSAPYIAPGASLLYPSPLQSFPPHPLNPPNPQFKKCQTS